MDYAAFKEKQSETRRSQLLSNISSNQDLAGID